LKAFAHIE